MRSPFLPAKHLATRLIAALTLEQKKRFATSIYKKKLVPLTLLVEFLSPFFSNCGGLMTVFCYSNYTKQFAGADDEFFILKCIEL